jgi:hypothetical protein
MRRQYSTGRALRRPPPALSDGVDSDIQCDDHDEDGHARLGFARKALGQTIVGAHADEETPGEDEDVTIVLPQWRESKGQHSQPVIEILAEHVLAHRSLEIGVGGADDPPVHRFRGGGAQASHDFLLEHLEKLGPRSKPNNSASSNESGIAAQLTSTKGPCPRAVKDARRGLCRCRSLH